MEQGHGILKLGSLFTLLLLVAFPAGAAELKLASIAPDGSQWMQAMRAGADEIRELTDGRVQIKLYPGGVMGNDPQVLRKIRIGQLHGGAFTAGGLGERYPALNLYGIPLLFNSLDEVDYVRERMDPLLAAGIEDAGFVTFGFTEGGFANLMADVPIRDVSDLSRKKIWVPDGDEISYRVMESLGLSPVVLPVTDVLTGLQTGLLDVVGASPVVALVMQWHTKVRYRTDLPVSYSMGVFAIEKRAFSQLEPADQSVVRDVMGRVMSELDHAARADNQRAAEVLAKAGVEAVDVSSADFDGLRETVAGIYDELGRRADLDADMLDRLLLMLGEYRAQHGGASQ